MIAKCRTERVTRLRQSGNERLCEPDESGEDGNEASNSTIPDERSDETPAPDDYTSNDPDYQPCRRSSEPNPSPGDGNGHGLGHQPDPETPRARSSKRPSRHHGQNHPEDDCNGETRAWTVDPSAATSSPLKRRRQSREPTPMTAPTADMSRRIITLKVDPRKLSALLRGDHRHPAIPGNASEMTIKEEGDPNEKTAASGTMRKKTRPEVLLELKTTTSPIIDLTDETPDGLDEVVQSAVAVDMGRGATMPPTPVSLVQSLTTSADLGHQSSSQTLSVQPVAQEQDTIAVTNFRLDKRIADSLGAVVTGEASYANVVDGSKDQSNEPRSTDPEQCMSGRIVGTASNDDDEDLYSSTPPPPNMHSHDIIEPTATAPMLLPGTISSDERPRADDSSREQDGHQAEETRLRDAGGQLASPVSTGAESGHGAASLVADESRHADPLRSIDIEQMVQDDAAMKERVRQMRQKLREQERTLREEREAASRRTVERAREFEQLERQSQYMARQTEAVRQVGLPSSFDDKVI